MNYAIHARHFIDNYHQKQVCLLKRVTHEILCSGWDMVPLEPRFSESTSYPKWLAWLLATSGTGNKRCFMFLIGWLHSLFSDVLISSSLHLQVQTTLLHFLEATLSPWLCPSQVAIVVLSHVKRDDVPRGTVITIATSNVNAPV